MKNALLLGCVCGFLTALAPTVRADSFGANFTNTVGESLSNGPFTFGWSFTVSGTINVTDLGVFDSSGTALSENHAIGIWNSSGTLLDSASVSGRILGTLETDSLGQTWRDVSAPVTLGPGTYTIGAVWLDGADLSIFPGQLSGVTMGSGITFLQDQYIAGSSLTDPTSTSGETGAYFGPNFEYSGVPEPGSLFLLGSGVFAIGLGRWGRARRRAN